MQIESMPVGRPARRRVNHRFYIRLVIAMADEYAVMLALFLLAKLVIGERWEIIAFGNSFLLLALLPAFVLLPVALFRRRWPIVLILLLATVFFLVSYGVFFLPRSVAAAAESRQVKILTYNIHSETAALDPIIAVIRASDADVVALQEVSEQAAARFARELIVTYPYQTMHTTPGNAVIGQGILSRYPLLSDDYWRNEALPAKLGHLRVEVAIHQTRLTLYDTHPVHPILKEGHLFYTTLRSQEIASVLQRANQDTGSVIIVGDFNMADQSDSYREITASYADTYREVGWGLGFTFPDFTSATAVPGRFSLPFIRPVVRLDYLFHNRAVRSLEARVWPTSGGSDHRPVFARFELDG